jgi:hypothetical protein
MILNGKGPVAISGLRTSKATTSKMRVLILAQIAHRRFAERQKHSESRPSGYGDLDPHRSAPGKVAKDRRWKSFTG